MKCIERIEKIVINNNRLRRLLMKPTIDSFFQGGRNFQWKDCIKPPRSVRIDEKNRQEKLQDFSEG